AAIFFARTGIIGAVMLGFGRALGETMARTMVICNNPRISASLFAPQYTMAAVLANEFTEADTDLHIAALIEIGLVLFVITLVIHGLSPLLISGFPGFLLGSGAGSGSPGAAAPLAEAAA